MSNVIIKKKGNAMHEHTKKTFPETNKDVFCHRCIEWNQSEMNAYQMPHCDIEVMCGFRFLFVKELNIKLNQVYLSIATCTFTLQYQYWWNHSPRLKSIGHLELLNLLSSLTDWTILYTCASKELQMGQPLFWRLIALHAGQNSMHKYKWDILKWKSNKPSEIGW